MPVDSTTVDNPLCRFPKIVAMFGKIDIEDVWHLLWLVLNICAMDEGWFAYECEGEAAWGLYQSRVPKYGPVNAFLRWCAKENFVKFLRTCTEVDFTDRTPSDVVRDTDVLPGLGALTLRDNGTLLLTIGDVTVPIPHDLWCIIAETPVGLAYPFAMLIPAGSMPMIYNPDIDTLREKYYAMQ